MVEFPSNGGTTRGYVATGEGAGLGVVVIQEWWGVVPHIQDVCDRLAAEGFTALAPDLFHGLTVPNAEPDEAEKQMMALNLPRAAKDLSGAVDFLVDHPAVRGHGVAVVGFCMGGGLALWLAAERPDQVRACVPFYGAIPWDEVQPDWDRIEAAVEGHYGEADGWATPESAHHIEQELVDRGKEVRLFTYPGQGHAFFNDTRPEAYDEDAARQAWVRTLEFLRRHLG
ncbi:MAG: dienelactone hydrolase family protein [Acidimicrobiales bacterium]